MSDQDNIEMRMQIGGGRHVDMSWPRGLTVSQLNRVEKVLKIQIDLCREIAAEQDAGDLEYESWFQTPSHSGHQKGDL